MFAAKFDDTKRKLLSHDKPVLLHKLTTVAWGTEEFETYVGLYNMPENESIHLIVEDDEKTYTFFTVFDDPKIISQQLERNREKLLNDKRTSSNASFA